MIIQSNAHWGSCLKQLYHSEAFAKYNVENYAVEAFIGKSKVESDKILLNFKVIKHGIVRCILLFCSQPNA